ncbi:reverse transcriptase domain-containing protein [Rheinheimera sp. F8]|uniref:reverse transcriptase domain-containing protein n=1 Tax=Rheinheimera sp. F8 TaxID=1763998 RepID=UPI000ABC8082|nr:reverse transcriptase domain-containing protein [Rheinheimera sp. F8]
MAKDQIRDCHECSLPRLNYCFTYTTSGDTSGYEQHLVQGALTSSYIANLVFWDVEHQVVKRLKRMGLKYTRLIDDITISSKTKNFDFSLAERIVEEMLRSKDLPTNSEKRQLSYSGITPLKVHGLQVNYSSPIFPKEEVKRIFAAVHEVKVRAKVLHQNSEKAYRNLYNRTLGRVNKLARVQNDRRVRMVNILMSEDLKPKPSEIDRKFCDKRYNWLVKNYTKSKDKYIYHHRFYYLKSLLHFMINNGDGKFDVFSEDKLKLIQNIRPTHVDYSK